MKKKIELVITLKYILLLIILFISCTSDKNEIYTTPETPWAESLGSHRAVIEIDKPADAVKLDLTWRRHDKNPEDRKFIIVHENGDTIKNIHRIHVDNEKCELVFGPVKNPGKYFFYYLPYFVQEGHGGYNKGYLKPENKPIDNWLQGVENSNLPNVKLVEFQSRTEFDSFYPMEIIALKSEKDSLLNIHKEEFLVFPEDREFPIRMLDEVPQKWIESGPSSEFKGEAHKNEYYTFQLGVFATQMDLNDLKVEFSSLKNGNAEIPASNLTCFNTGGIDSYGESFVKRVDVEKENVQPLWIGVDIPENIKTGNYTGKVVVLAEDIEPQTIKINIKVVNSFLEDRGDNEPWRHSRLRWLNSTLGIDDKPTKPYQPISYLDENSFGFTGKTMTLAESGFPSSLKIKDSEILNRPVLFVVETVNGKEQFSAAQNVHFFKNESGIKAGSWKSVSQNMRVSGIGTLEADGYINYKVQVEALKDIKSNDIRLEIPLKNEVAKYMMGMDLSGTEVAKNHSAKWNGPHDSFWIGDVDAGIWCELRGGKYHGPLLNLFKPEYPASWYNNNKGGFEIKSNSDEITVVVYSGSHDFEKGETLNFEWSMLLTPVKDINYKSQFKDRYYHNGQDPMPSDEDLESGVQVVNLHHANNYNPYINYPFIAVDSMKWFVDQLHEKGQKVKIYYTIRELTNYTTEIWALRSLGNEILGDGNGGGYPWLREHLVDGYQPQWYHRLSDTSADASIVNAPGDSRWYNYYIAGLEWLVKNVDIDGLYLDDVSYDRRTVKRIRKVLDSTKPGCLLDLHSNTGFSKGPATQYTEFFPYMDKIWFGESFHYDEMSPANWLVEVSGIPFGLMGDMLHAGGNRWLGMLFGMTVRHPWLTEGVVVDPRSIWRVWDEFGIQDAQMVGFWEQSPVVTTDNKDVKATSYVKDGKTLISLGNFSDTKKTVKLNFDWQELDINSSKAILYAPYIEGFQIEREFSFDNNIEVPSKKGWLLILSDE